MDTVFRVAIHYDNDYGYVEYDLDTNTVKVVIDNPVKKGEVEAYLAKEQIIPMPQKTLLDFVETKVNPSENLASFQTAMTLLWKYTGVFVDWSRLITLQ